MVQSLKQFSLQRVEAKENTLVFEAKNPSGTTLSILKHYEAEDCYERVCVAADGRKSILGISTQDAKNLAAKCRSAGFSIKFDDNTL